jgi:hypothetical protein
MNNLIQPDIDRVGSVHGKMKKQNLIFDTRNYRIRDDLAQNQ